MIPRLNGPDPEESAEIGRLFDTLASEKLTERQQAMVAELKQKILAQS